MKSLLLVGLAAFCVTSSFAVGWDSWENEISDYITVPQQRKVVCFWNSTSFYRKGLGKFDVKKLRPALSMCTHLIYGWAGIHPRTSQVISLHPILDTKAIHGYYQQVTSFKRLYPALKVCLGVGGDGDSSEHTHKYLNAIKTWSARNNFIESVDLLLNTYNFDGVDLSWQFPSFASTIHRNDFTELVRDLREHLRNKSVTITIIPGIGDIAYYDIRSLVSHIEAIHMIFDSITPEVDPWEADYPYPIYGRESNDPSIDSTVRYLLQHGAPGSKIIVGIPTFARTWRIVSKNVNLGEPPIAANGPGGSLGVYTSKPGFMAYPEVCHLIAGGYVKRGRDVHKKMGSYAYWVYNHTNRTPGDWIGYEDPYTSREKATYVKKKGLGGVAIFDLSNDDFRGECNGEAFPILHGAVYDRL